MPTRQAETREAFEVVEAFLSQRRAGLVRGPRGQLRHPFVDPGSVYTGQLWDWDSYFTLVALGPHVDAAAASRGCVENFLGHQRGDGSVPFRVAEDTPPEPTGGRKATSPLNSAKPVLAQLALLGLAGNGSQWASRVWPGLMAHTEHWQDSQRHATGLFSWRSHRGSGADNHPGVYGRPLNATAGIDLNCLFVREYDALADLAELVGDDRAAGLRVESRKLSAAVRRHLWDPVTEDFCHADLQSRTPEGANQRVDWVVPLRYRSWVGFYALWAAVATQAQAEAMVRRVFASTDLICEFGIRTLSSREPLFNLDRSSNPSNWQGPVWVMSNYVAFTGLLAYGMVDQARHVMEGTLVMLARDIQRTGTLHEYYHPDTGEGLMNAGFLNWNLLATTMYREFQARIGS